MPTTPFAPIAAAVLRLVPPRDGKSDGVEYLPSAITWIGRLPATLLPIVTSARLMDPHV